MPKSRSIKVLALTVFTQFLNSCNQCTAQYDSAPMKAQLNQEEKIANTQQVTLTETGELPSVGVKKIDAAERYATLCASCHGAQGAGDGPGALALNPKPRNLTELAWQQATSDDRITKVIKSGGASVGLSATMAPWGAVLSDEEIAAVVAYIRTMSK